MKSRALSRMVSSRLLSTQFLVAIYQALQEKEQTNAIVTNQLEPGEVQSEGQSIATGILFADTLAKFLGIRKIKGSKGKDNIKWDGILEDLKSFVELVKSIIEKAHGKVKKERSNHSKTMSMKSP